MCAAIKGFLCVCGTRSGKRDAWERVSMSERARESTGGFLRMQYCFWSTGFTVQLFSSFDTSWLQHRMANHFNYSEAIDLLNELTYSSGPQSHNSMLPCNVRSGSSAAHWFSFLYWWNYFLWKNRKNSAAALKTPKIDFETEELKLYCWKESRIWAIFL